MYSAEICTVNNAKALVLHLQLDQIRKIANAGVSVAQDCGSLTVRTILSVPSPRIRLAEAEHGCTVESRVAAGSQHSTN